MEYWARNCWKPYVKEESLLVLDMHKAQRTETIKYVLEKECKITLVFVPAGCTSVVQPLDVSFNAPFKKAVESAVMQHIQENLAQSFYKVAWSGLGRIVTKLYNCVEDFQGMWGICCCWWFWRRWNKFDWTWRIRSSTSMTCELEEDPFDSLSDDTDADSATCTPED